MLCLVSLFPECLALFVWNPVWFPQTLPCHSIYTKEEPYILSGFSWPCGSAPLIKVNSCWSSDLTNHHMVSSIYKIDTTWLLSIKGVLGGNSAYSQTFCVFYSFQKKNTFIYFILRTGRRNIHVRMCVYGGHKCPSMRGGQRTTLRGQFFPSKCALWG